MPQDDLDILKKKIQRLTISYQHCRVKSVVHC